MILHWYELKVTSKPRRMSQNLADWEKVEFHSWNIVHVEENQFPPSRLNLHIALSDNGVLFPSKNNWIWVRLKINEPIPTMSEVAGGTSIYIPGRGFYMVCRSFSHEGVKGRLALLSVLHYICFRLWTTLLGLCSQSFMALKFHMTKFMAVIALNTFLL